MKKFFAVFLCIVILTTAICAFTACDDLKNEGRQVDMSLRSDTLYGLYWYGDSGETDDTMISQENMPAEYYDPSKPTLIYSHGWKLSSEEREEFSTLSKTISKTGGASGNYNYAKELKELGYNVAFWDWYDYAHELENLQNEIWVVKSADSISDKDSNYYAAVKALDGRSFAGEFVRSMNAVMKNAGDQDVILVGHSFGGQVVTAAAYTLYKLADEGIITNTNILPDRISLADPYMPGTEVSGEMDMLEETVSPTPTALKAADAFEYLNSKGAVIDFNGAMSTMTYNAYAGMFPVKDKAVQTQITEKIKNNTVYVIQDALINAYGKVGDTHVISRDYILTTFIEGKKGNLSGCTPNVSMTAAQLREYVGREFSLAGKGFLISDATMTEILDE